MLPGDQLPVMPATGDMFGEKKLGALETIGTNKYAQCAWTFTCDHRMLGWQGPKYLRELISQGIADSIKNCDHLLVHSHSKYQWDKLLEPFNAVEKPVHIFPRHGNLSTATIAAALWLLYGEMPAPNKRFLFLGPASGLSVCICEWTSA